MTNNLRELAEAAISDTRAYMDDGATDMTIFHYAASPTVILELLDRQDRMEARCAELERDAARYQWIRFNYDDSLVMVGGDKGCAELYMEEELDKAIDTAMASVPKGE